MSSQGEREALLPPSAKMPHQAEQDKVRNQARFISGVALLLSVVFLWTLSNFITGALETGEGAWNKPFMITYLNTASFVFYLIPSYFKYRRQRKSDYLPVQTSELQPPPSPATYTTRISLDNANLVEAAPLPKLTVFETAKVAAWWSAVWFLGNWAVNAALAWTSVASTTILTSTSGFFTLALGRVFRVETLTRVKIFAAIASFLGVVLVTQSDSSLATASSGDSSYPDVPSNPILGDFAAIISSIAYAVYVVLLKVQLGDEDRADPILLLGFAGLYNVICLIPVFPLLHWTGVETFELPPTSTAWLICGINGLITLSSDYIYILAVLKTSPMLVTVGLSLTIPCALVGSLFVPSAAVSAITFTSLVGAVLVCLGFTMLGSEGWKKSQEPDGGVFRGEGRDVDVAQQEC